MKWRAADDALDRTHPGTFNRVIVSAFLVPVEPPNTMPALLRWFEKSKLQCTGNVRAYVQGRIYELRRRGLLEVVE
jgi:hypothetical protein